MDTGTESVSDLAAFYQSLSRLNVEVYTSNFELTLERIVTQKSEADELVARYNEISAARQVEYYVRAANIEFMRFEARRRSMALRLGKTDPSNDGELQHILSNLPPYHVLRAELLELRKVRAINSRLEKWQSQLRSCVQSLENLGAAWSAAWCWYHQECVGTDGMIDSAFAAGTSLPDWNIRLHDPDYEQCIAAGGVVSADESPWTGEEAFACLKEEEQKVKRFGKAAVRAQRQVLELIAEDDGTTGDVN